MNIDEPFDDELNKKKPKLLFLDDEQWRHEKVEQRLYHQYDIRHVWTVDQLKSALELSKYDLISLDHDLGTHAGNGLQAAKIVAGLPKWFQPDIVIIHSWNIPAADAMFSVLQNAGLVVWREPFRAKD